MRNFALTLLLASSLLAAVKPASSRKAAPDFDLKDSAGQSFRLSGQKGRVVLLNFWATWCVPCKTEIPWFAQFDQTYKDRGLTVLGVSLDEDGWKAIALFLAHTTIPYKVLLGDEKTAKDYGGVDAMPTTLLIDKEGRVAAIYKGLGNRKTFTADIEKLLE